MNALGHVMRLQSPIRLLSREEADELDRRKRLSDLQQALNEWLPRDLATARAADLFGRIGESIRSAVTSWTPSRGNLLLLGDTGAGKTSAAAWLAKRTAFTLAAASDAGLEEACRVRWVTARSLGVARKEAKLGSAVELIERAKRAKLLVLDDVGQGDSRDDLFDVLDHRYVTRAPTIVTSGLTRGEIVERFGPEVMRRIMTNGGRDTMVVESWSREGR